MSCRLSAGLSRKNQGSADLMKLRRFSLLSGESWPTCSFDTLERQSARCAYAQPHLHTDITYIVPRRRQPGCWPWWGTAANVGPVIVGSISPAVAPANVKTPLLMGTDTWTHLHSFISKRERHRQREKAGK